MRTFYIGRVLAEQGSHLFRVAVDDVRMDRDEPTARTLFNDLQIVPIGTRLLVGRGSASPSVFGDLSPSGEHRLTIASFPIGRQSWRSLRMPTVLELRHQLEGHFFLRFGNGPSNTQPTL